MDIQKRAWVYTCVDAPEDARGILKKQEKELLDYAEQLGFSVVGGSSDLGSRKDVNRDGLADVTVAAEQDRFDVLLIMRLPRIGRDSNTVTAFLYALARSGKEIYSPLEGKINIKTLSRWLSDADASKTQEPEMRGHRHA